MPASLRPLVLPQLVQDDKLRNSIDSDRSPSDPLTTYHTPTSSFSDASAPSTPTFSLRGHSRLPSSASSLDATLSNSAPVSPAILACNDTVRSPKRSLPNVEEEHEDYDMSDEAKDPTTFSADSVLVPAESYDCDLTDGFVNQGSAQLVVNNRAKKRRSGESPFANIWGRNIGSRLPSFRRRWFTPKTAREDAPSRSTSTRSPSLYRDDYDEGCSYPPTPNSDLMECDDEAKSDFGVPKDTALEGEEEERAQVVATTPLLPPLMVPDFPSQMESPQFQSPLQSPSVCAETHSPVLAAGGMPSPPLSTKPSVCSFHPSSTRQLVPSSEIPPMLISEPPSDWEQRWATQLGHANFTPLPEPYSVGETASAEAIRQLRADYEAACTSYTRHLMRTGEHYGTTSRTYQLSEEKWAQIDKCWKSTLDCTVALDESDCQISDDSPNIRPSTKIPTLVDTRGESKFPTLGDGEIVGPMTQYVSQLHQRPSRRATFIKFLQDVKFPASILTGRDRS